MRALRAPIGVIPRAFRDHRSRVAKVFRAYCLTAQATWGPLPAIALPTLKEAARAHVELQRLSDELEVAHARKRRRDVARLRKHQFMLREQLNRLEQRLAEHAAPRPRTPMATLAAQKAVS